MDGEGAGEVGGRLWASFDEGDGESGGGEVAGEQEPGGSRADDRDVDDVLGVCGVDGVLGGHVRRVCQPGPSGAGYTAAPSPNSAMASLTMRSRRAWWAPRQ